MWFGLSVLGRHGNQASNYVCAAFQVSGVNMESCVFLYALGLYVCTGFCAIAVSLVNACVCFRHCGFVQSRSVDEVW